MWLTRLIPWLLLVFPVTVVAAPAHTARITIDYPEDASVFPPEFPAPLFQWRDSQPDAAVWKVQVTFADGADGLEIDSEGAPMQLGEIDPRCVSPTNELPTLTPEQAAAHTWRPKPEIWEAIKKHSLEDPATITISGFSKGGLGQPLSIGKVTIQTSKDPVGAPIFYRDVPLMPADTEKGVIKPLVPEAIPLIAWRLRDVSRTKSRLLMQDLPTCANCHSVSADGTTMGMDVDGPLNDKGLYAVFPLKPHTSIRNQDVITWRNVYQGTLGGRLRVGFMSQVSPDGQSVVTTINDPGAPQTDSERRSRPQDLIGNYYVANFKDFRFGQVFFPTRGILAWYDRRTAKLKPLSGADDPRYVQTGATWSPDGKYLVFSRAEAGEAYPAGAKPALYANDPNETQIQYDLYRIPFNGGKGGRAEPLVGASQNGMSNNFPKVSPDGRWIVFVQCRNGQLMRPDSQLYIIPSSGGKARRMRCNTPRMNSWHSFSPNSRWLVFSSKSPSPYTEMYLTHIDEEGRDSPAILIENATAANRAVNIPEFLNISGDVLAEMDAPATDFYRLFNQAAVLVEKGQYEEALPQFRHALELNPEDVRAHDKLGIALAGLGRLDEAVAEYTKASELDPKYADAHLKLGIVLARMGKREEAKQQLQKGLEIFPDSAEGHSNLAALLLGEGRFQEAIAHCQKALSANADYAGAHGNLGIALAKTGKSQEAIPHLEKALASEPASAELQLYLGRALAEGGRIDEAVPHLQKAAAAMPDSAQVNYNLARILLARGRLGDAIPYFEKALAAAPDSLEVRRELISAVGHLAWIRATSTDAKARDGSQAVLLAKEAVQLSGGREPAILEVLSAAYAEAGRFSKALETARRALEFAREEHNQALTAGLNRAITSYEAKKPLRQ